jgi:hypothetical protein
MGTPWFVAPEQMEDASRIDHRADLYSVSVLLYELLTGELPTGIDPPSARRASLDPAWDGILRRGMDRDPGRRPPDAATMAREIRAIGKKGGVPRWALAAGTVVLVLAAVLIGWNLLPDADVVERPPEVIPETVQESGRGDPAGEAGKQAPEVREGPVAPEASRGRESDEAPRKVQDAKVDPAKQEREYRDRIVDARAVDRLDRSREWVLVGIGGDDRSGLLVRRLADALRGGGKSVHTGIFRSAAFDEDTYDSLASGNDLDRFGLNDIDGYALVGRLELSDPKSGGVGGTVSCRGSLELDAVPLSGGEPFHVSASVPGAGFSEDTAREAVLKRLVEAATKDPRMMELIGPE